MRNDVVDIHVPESHWGQKHMLPGDRNIYIL